MSISLYFFCFIINPSLCIFSGYVLFIIACIFYNNLKLISQHMLKLAFILWDIEFTDSLEFIQRNIFLMSWWFWSWYNSFHQYFQIASHINYEIISTQLIVIIIYSILNYYWLHIFESINFKKFPRVSCISCSYWCYPFWILASSFASFLSSLFLNLWIQT